MLLDARSNVSAAAQNGDLDMLQWLRGHDPPYPWELNEILEVASRQGHLYVFYWILTQFMEQNQIYPNSVKAISKILHDACHAAASGGHLNMLIWLRSQKPPCYWMPGPMYLLQHKMEI